MRGILVGWLVGLHSNFKLSLETLYLSVNLIDRYSEIVIVKREEY